MEALAIFLCALAASESVFADLEREANASRQASKASERPRDGVDEMPYVVSTEIITSQRISDARKRTSEQVVVGRKSAKSVETKALERGQLFSNVAPIDLKTDKMFNGTLVDLRTFPPSNNTSAVVVRRKLMWAAYLKDLRAVTVALRALDIKGKSENGRGNYSSRRKRAYEVNDPFFISLNEYDAICKKLPVELQYAVAATNHYEDELLLGYATATAKRDMVDSVLTEYVQAKCSERKTLKELSEKAGSARQELVANYKSLRKGVAWLYKKLDLNLKSFFDSPSAFLTEYDILKRDELDSIDSYLSGTIGCEAAASGDKKVENSTAVAEVKKAEEEEEELMRVKDADTTRSLIESYEAMRAVRRRLPEDLQRLIEVTDGFEDRLIDSYVTTQVASTKLLADYYAAKKAERELLRELASEMAPTAASDLVNNYKTLRKGRVWNYVKLQDRYKAFFRRFSAGLLEFETLKMDELTSIDRFLNLPPPVANKTSELNAVNQAVAHGAELTEDGKTTYAELLRTFPGTLKDSILQTDHIERQILDFLAKSQSVPRGVLDAYKASRNEEREQLRMFIADRSQNKTSLIEAYKALRKGAAWKFVQEEQPYADFFNRPSPALTDYEALKREELTTLGSFLAGKPRKHRRAKKRRSKRQNQQAPAFQTNTQQYPGVTTPGVTTPSVTTPGVTTPTIEGYNTTASSAGVTSGKAFMSVVIISLISQSIVLILILFSYRHKISGRLYQRNEKSHPEKSEKEPLKKRDVKAKGKQSAKKTELVASQISKTAIKDSMRKSTTIGSKPSKPTILGIPSAPPVTQPSKPTILGTTSPAPPVTQPSKPTILGTSPVPPVTQPSKPTILGTTSPAPPVTQPSKPTILGTSPAPHVTQPSKPTILGTSSAPTVTQTSKPTILGTSPAPPLTQPSKPTILSASSAPTVTKTSKPSKPTIQGTSTIPPASVPSKPTILGTSSSPTVTQPSKPTILGTSSSPPVTKPSKPTIQGTSPAHPITEAPKTSKSDLRDTSVVSLARDTSQTSISSFKDTKTFAPSSETSKTSKSDLRSTSSVVALPTDTSQTSISSFRDASNVAQASESFRRSNTDLDDANLTSTAESLASLRRPSSAPMNVSFRPTGDKKPSPADTVKRVSNISLSVSSRSSASNLPERSSKSGDTRRQF